MKHLREIFIGVSFLALVILTILIAEIFRAWWWLIPLAPLVIFTINLINEKIV